jgi:hypothetical protein
MISAEDKILRKEGMKEIEKERKEKYRNKNTALFSCSVIDFLPFCLFYNKNVLRIFFKECIKLDYTYTVTDA